MRSALLPFERSFQQWIEKESMGWEELPFPLAGAGEASTAYRFTPAGPTKRIVFTLHGAGNDALFAWVGLFKQLLLRDTEIFTFDLPGHGRSNQTLFTDEVALEAVRAALAHCRGRQVPLHGLGVSLGGAVLLRALPAVEKIMSSAILIEAPLRIMLDARAVMAEVGAHTIALLWREREHYGLTGLVPSFGPFKRDIYPLRLKGWVPPGPFGYVAALNDALELMDLERAAADTDIPVLLIYGTADRVVPIDQGERLARILPEAELFPVPGGTHLSTPMEPLSLARLLEWIERPRW